MPCAVKSDEVAPAAVMTVAAKTLNTSRHGEAGRTRGEGQLSSNPTLPPTNCLTQISDNDPPLRHRGGERLCCELRRRRYSIGSIQRLLWIHARALRM